MMLQINRLQRVQNLCQVVDIVVFSDAFASHSLESLLHEAEMPHVVSDHNLEELSTFEVLK